MTRILSANRRLLLSQASNHTNQSETKEEFEGNLEIILAALLCALIVAIGLNWIAHCALRRSRAPPPSAAARTGVKKRHLKRIPVVVHGSGLPAQLNEECSICLGEFSDGERVRVLPKCSHEFHVWCIDQWLALHSSCPICRNSVAGSNPTVVVDP
ncbi:RING-H2 finger protein ATL72 [Linum perenne]